MAGSRSRRGPVGLDIGTSAVRAVELSVGGGTATLHKFGQVALPRGVVVDGEIVDAEAVTVAVRQLWQAVKFGSRNVVLGVANQRVVVRQVDLPWMADKELRKSLPFQVDDLIPMPVDEAVLDIHPLEEVVAEDGRRLLRVMLVAAGKEMVRVAVDAVTRAGLTPVAVDLTPFAVLRSLGGGSSVIGLETESEAIIDVGAHVTNIVVHQNAVPQFVRMLLLGGDDLTDQIAERLGVDAATAEGTKATLSLAGDPAQVDQHPAQRALEAGASQWVEEVRQSLQYHVSQTGIRIKRIVLTGGGSSLGGLAQRLATTARLPVVVASPLTGLQVGRTGLEPEQLASVQARLAVPVGLALGRAS